MFIAGRDVGGRIIPETQTAGGYIDLSPPFFIRPNGRSLLLDWQMLL